MARWANWSGIVECIPERIYAPRSLEELQDVVRLAANERRCLRVAGAGHSFTELVKTGDFLVSLDHLSGLEAVDHARHEVTVWAGTRLWRLNELLEEQGMAMANLGDINKQSIAGAVSTGTHGTGITLGNLSSYVTGITLVAADGSLVECDERTRPDLFKAAQVSLGSLGVIARVRLRTVPAYRLRYTYSRASLTEVVANLERYRDHNRHFEFFYFPYSDYVQLKLHNETHEPAAPKRAARWLNEVISENASIEALSWLCAREPSRCAAISRFFGRMVSSGEIVDAGHSVLSTKRIARFNEMEYAVPAEAGVDCLLEIKDWIEREHVAVNLPIEFRYVKGDDIWLSPAYERDICTISLHMYHRMPYEQYFNGAELIFRRYDGRPHWGKLHGLNAFDFATMYVKWGEFQAVRSRLDPNGVFINQHLQRVLGPVA